MPQVKFDPVDQRIRRKRALLSQADVGAQFIPPISDTSISEYEQGGKLAYEFTGEDYEIALQRAIKVKAAAK